METITSAVEKRARLTKPYKGLYKKWKAIAYGLACLALMLGWLLASAIIRVVK